MILPIFFVIGRTILRKLQLYFQNRGLGLRNVLIYTDGTDCKSLINKITMYPELGYRLKGLLFTNQDVKRSNGDTESENNQPKYIISQIEKVAKRENIEIILTPTIEDTHDGFKKILTKCEKNEVKFKIISNEAENLLRFTYITDIAGIPLYLPPRRRIKFIKNILKRAFDIIGSLFALILLSPLFLLISVAIIIEDGFPIFYKQKRALVKGKNEFMFYKFRSMIKNAESLQDEMYKVNLASGGLFRVKDDPRITKVGKFIRKLSLDEIPQFYNVLKGDMSLVGPRPLSLADLSNISPENTVEGYYKLRAEVKPGITGLWQISGRRELSFRNMVLLDLYYIENQTVIFDLEILFKTIPVVFFGKGAY